MLLYLPCPVLAAPEQARHGYVDLSNLDLAGGKTAKLDGEWEFYWGELLTPTDFTLGKHAHPGQYLNVPQSWEKAQYQGQTLPAKGVATYRLIVQPPTGQHDLALRIGDIPYAYNLWVDGKLLQSVGQIGHDVKSEHRGARISVVHFAGDGKPIELLIQVSNYHFIRGMGALSSIQFGAAETLSMAQMHRWGVASLMAGFWLLMCIYHIALFAARPKDWAPLLFFFYCVTRSVVAFGWSMSDWLLMAYFPTVDAEIVEAVVGQCLLLAGPLSMLFFRSIFPEEFSARACKFVTGITAVFTILCVAKGYSEVGQIFLYFYLYAIGLTLYFTYALSKAAWHNRIGAKLIMFGWLCLGLTGVNDFLIQLNWIESIPLSAFGLTLFVLFQSFALANRFSRAFNTVENLSQTLDEQNAVLREEMDERLRLEHEIEKVRDVERRTIGRQLHDGLCQELTAARLHCSVLRFDQNTKDMPSRGFDQMGSLLNDAVDHAYELSRGLWPVENESNNLVSTLEGLAGKTRTEYGFEIGIHCSIVCEICQHKNAIQIYQIAQEALRNIGKHAHAKHVIINMDCVNQNGKLLIRVEDDGVGRRGQGARTGGLGSRIMAHTAKTINAELNINDGPNGGTVVSLRVPCHHTSFKSPQLESTSQHALNAQEGAL